MHRYVHRKIQAWNKNKLTIAKQNYKHTRIPVDISLLQCKTHLLGL